MSKLKIIVLFFIVSLIVFTLVNVLQTIAWGQSPREPYPKFAVMVERVKPNATNAERARWKTYGTAAIVPGKDANLYISYSEEFDEWSFCLEATDEHAKTDGYIPPLKIVPTLSNVIRLQARKE